MALIMERNPLQNSAAILWEILILWFRSLLYQVSCFRTKFLLVLLKSENLLTDGLMFVYLIYFISYYFIYDKWYSLDKIFFYFLNCKFVISVLSCYFSFDAGNLLQFDGEFFDKFDAVIVGHSSSTTKVLFSLFFQRLIHLFYNFEKTKHHDSWLKNVNIKLFFAIACSFELYPFSATENHQWKMSE